VKEVPMKAMNRAVAELVTAAAEIVIGKDFSYWESNVRRAKGDIAEIKKKVDFWAREVGKIGELSMVERSLKKSSDNLDQASKNLDPLSQVKQLGNKTGLRAA
jgi:hypothetical protein